MPYPKEGLLDGVPCQASLIDQTPTPSVLPVRSNITFTKPVCSLPLLPSDLKGKKPTIVAPPNDSQGTQKIDPRKLATLLGQRRAEPIEPPEEASLKLGMCHQTLYKWEHSIRTPHLKLYPRIVAYLGHDPWAEVANACAWPGCVWV